MKAGNPTTEVADRSQRVYRHHWLRWLLPVFMGGLAGILAAAGLSSSDRDLPLLTISTAFGGFIAAGWVLQMLRQPRKFVLRDRILEVHWLWRKDEVRTNRLTIREPRGGNSSLGLSLRYDNRLIDGTLAADDLGDLRTELLVRGAQIETESVVTVTVSGASTRSEKVPLMLLLKDRLGLSQAEARDEAIRILSGEPVILRLKSEVDARYLRKELRELGIVVQNEETA